MDWSSLPPLTALRAFSALAQAGSYSAAGRMLNVSHAAISQQVRGLESHLGASLVARDGRGVALTPEGRELARVLADGFGTIADGVEALAQTDQARPLQVSVTPSFASNWMMPRLHRFRQAHPDINLMLNPTAKVVDLAPGGVDVAVRFGNGDWPGLQADYLIETSYVIAAHRDLIKDRVITSPADLAGLPWVQEYGTNEMTAWIARQGLPSLPAEQVTHLPGYMLVEAVKRGQAVGATVDIYLTDEVASGEVVILFSEQRQGAGYWLVTRPGVQRAPLRAFSRWMRSEVTSA